MEKQAKRIQAHTPGPWGYQALGGNHDFAVYSESDGKDLALVRHFHEANAQLIAAAPDLLAAAQEALAYLYNKGIPDLETRTVQSKLNKAIAKAKATTTQT
jgi:hypothetical protein